MIHTLLLFYFSVFIFKNLLENKHKIDIVKATYVFFFLDLVFGFRNIAFIYIYLYIFTLMCFNDAMAQKPDASESHHCKKVKQLTCHNKF